MGDGGVGVLESRVGGFVAVVVLIDAFAVHAHAADEGALAGGVGERGEEVGGGDVDGGVVGCCRGAVAEERGDAAGVDTVGGGEGGERGLEGESVSAEPGEEGGGAENTGVRELRGVGVSIWGWSEGNFLDLQIEREWQETKVDESTTLKTASFPFVSPVPLFKIGKER